MTTCFGQQVIAEQNHHKEKTAEIYQFPTVQIASDEVVEQSKNAAISARDAVSQIKLLSGLTQEQISEILGVDRRSTYHWLAGQEPSDTKYEKLMRILSALQYMDRGITRINKRILLSPAEGGKLNKDYLTEGNFQKFLQVVGSGDQKPKLNIQQSGVSPLDRGKTRLIEMLSD
jgi:transcriptional regulator with XRE-family HTH domain